MFAKLEGLEKKYMELEQALAQPDVYNDQDQYRKLTKAHADLRDVVELFRRHRSLTQELEENKQLLHDSDPDIKAMAQEEIAAAEAELPELEHKIKVLLLPKDPLDEKNTILEIRAGTGGEEAALFAADLFRMYTRYAEIKGWKVEIMSESPSDSGGYKEIICLISGDRVYSHLKFEAGTHRVQRVPATETQGRIHTSAATVAVMPEAEEVDVEIRPEDLRIDIYRASGAGGQHAHHRAHPAVLRRQPRRAHHGRGRQADVRDAGRPGAGRPPCGVRYRGPRTEGQPVFPDEPQRAGKGAVPPGIFPARSGIPGAHRAGNDGF